MSRLPATYYEAKRAAALRGARMMFRDRNNCRASAAYYRDCVRAAIREIRECDVALCFPAAQ